MSFFRPFFPALSASYEVYLDSAATSHRVDACLNAMQDYYLQFNANVHRGNYKSARLASNQYEAARETMARFLGAQTASQIVFTSGATDAINLIGNGLNIGDLQGNEILLCESEHHSNLLVWQVFAKRHNLVVKKISLGKNGTFANTQLVETLNQMTSNVAILAIAHVSNALGNIYPIAQLCKKANEVGALSVVDGTQACAHITIDVNALSCDFYAISGHKMYASTGIGVLYGKTSWLEKLQPSKFGGEMISHVTWDSFTHQAPPGKFEAGTPNIAGAIGLAAAAVFISSHLTHIAEHELTLSHYLMNKLTPLIDDNKICILGNIGLKTDELEESSTIALVSFYSPFINSNDMAVYLGNSGIALRAGHHCAMPLMQSLSLEGCVRVSLACYTRFEDVDEFIKCLQRLFDENEGYDDQTDVTNLATAANVEVVKDRIPSIGASILSAPDWNSKHRLLLLASKQLPVLPEAQRTSAHEISGCEARVWVGFLYLHDGSKDVKRGLFAYSQSKVIRGILALIIEKVNQVPLTQATTLDIGAYLQQIGLSHYFSQGRRDGISHVIKHIKIEYEKLKHLI